jgi:hypothetical protein
MPHRHVARKVTIAVALGVLAVLATSAFAYRTVERVRIGSEEFDRAVLFNSVLVDTTPAPATLSDAYLLNIGLLDATPEQIEETVGLLDMAETAYNASIANWTRELQEEGGADANTALALLDELTEPANEFWRLSSEVVVPAAERGDTGAALEAVFGPLRESFTQHHDVGDRILTELVAAQERQEARTTDYIEQQRNIAIVVVSCVCLALVIAGLWLRIRVKREMSTTGKAQVRDDASDEKQLVDAIAR